MTIFKRTFDERDRTNKTSTARWHQPRGDSTIAQPSWNAIDDQNGTSRTDALPLPEDGMQEHSLQAKHVPAPLATPATFNFDDQELASFGAKAAHLGFVDGIEAGRQSDAGQISRLLDEIRSEIASFSACVELPISAIRWELTELLKAIVERLCDGDSAEHRHAMVEKIVTDCLAEFKSVRPLKIDLSSEDRQVVDEILTKLADNPGPGEVEFSTANDLVAGKVVVTWPGGGMERIVGGRDAALAALQTILDAQIEPESETSIEEGTPD